MNDWQLFLKEGKEFLRSAQGKEGKPCRLSNDIRYNLLAMSLEKSCMAILMQHGDLADNHTFSDLLDSLRRHITIPDELSREILALEQVQTICNLYEYHREIPSDQVVNRLLQVTTQIHQIAEPTNISNNHRGQEQVVPSQSDCTQGDEYYGKRTGCTEHYPF